MRMNQRRLARPANEPARPGEMRTNELWDVTRAIDRLTFDAGSTETRPRRPERPWVGFQRIVLAVDGSSASEWAVPWARQLADSFRSRVWIVTVVPSAAQYVARGLDAVDLH